MEGPPVEAPGDHVGPVDMGVVYNSDGLPVEPSNGLTPEELEGQEMVDQIPWTD